MTVNSESEKLALRAWFLTHRTRDVLRTCEDQIFSEYGLTTEQYAVLSIMKLLNDPVRVTDLAQWLERSTNSVSMIADRMVKAGLLRRVRDRKDRRVVWLAITSKGEEALEPSFKAGLEFIWKNLSHLSYEDKQTLLRLLLTVQYEAAISMNPEADIDEIKRNETKSHEHFMERLIQAYCPQLLEAKYQGDEKGKTTR